MKWFRLAAEGRYHDAQFKLSEMYKSGEGVPAVDLNYAYMWSHFAAEGGNKDAIKQTKEVENIMLPMDIPAAKELIQECIRKKYKGC